MVKTTDSTSLDERLRDLDLITRALGRAVQSALKRHKQAGNQVAVWRDGRVIWVEADDIPAPTESGSGPATV